MNKTEILHLTKSKGFTFRDTAMLPWNVPLHRLITFLSRPAITIAERKYQRDGKKCKDFKHFLMGQPDHPQFTYRGKRVNPDQPFLIDDDGKFILDSKSRKQKNYVLDENGKPLSNYTIANVMVIDGDSSLENSKHAPPISTYIEGIKSLNLPHLTYTSFSHKGENHSKYRSIIPLTTPVNRDQLIILYGDFIRRINSVGVDLAPASESYRPSQLWFLPFAREKYADQYKFRYDIAPPALDVKEWLEEASRYLSTDPIKVTGKKAKSRASSTKVQAVAPGRVNYGVNAYPEPKSFIDVLNHYYNNFKYIREMMEEEGYDFDSNDMESCKVLHPRSESGNHSGGFELGEGGKILYLAWSPNDPLCGPESKTSNTGYKPVDAIDIYSRLRLGETPETPLTISEKMEWYERKFYDYLTDRYVLLKGKSPLFVDLFKPDTDPLGPALLKYMYGKFMVPYNIQGKNGVTVEKRKIFDTWAFGNNDKRLDSNRLGGYRKTVDQSDGFDPSPHVGPIFQEKRNIVVNTFVPPIYRSLPKPQYPERYRIFQDHTRHLTSVGKTEYNVLMGMAAHLVQFPEERLRFSNLIISTEYGWGKSIYARLLDSVIGPGYLGILKPEKMPGRPGSAAQFQDQVIGKLLIVINEIDINWGQGFDFYNDSKEFLIDDQLALNRKNLKEIVTDVYFRTLAFTNELIPFPLPAADRRFHVINCEIPDRVIGDTVYRDEYVKSKIGGTYNIMDGLKSRNSSDRQWAHESLHAIHYYLMNYDTTYIRSLPSAPMTAHKRAIINASDKPIDRLMKEVLEISPYVMDMKLLAPYLSRMMDKRGIKAKQQEVNKVLFNAYPITGDNRYVINVHPNTYQSGDRPNGGQYVTSKLRLIASADASMLHSKWAEKSYSFQHKYSPNRKGFISFMKDEMIKARELFTRSENVIPFEELGN